MTDQFLQIVGWLGLILIAGCIFGTGYYIGRLYELRSRR